MKTKRRKIRTKPTETEAYTYFVEDIRTLIPSFKILKFAVSGRRRKTTDTPPPQDPTDGDKMIRVLMVHEFASDRERFQDFISSQPDMIVVGEATTAKEAIDLFPILRPNVVSVGMCHSDLNSIDLTAIIMSRFPEANVLIVSMRYDLENLRKALFAGAKDYLPTFVEQEDYVTAIRVIARPYIVDSEESEEEESNDAKTQDSITESRAGDLSSDMNTDLEELFSDSPKHYISHDEISKLWNLMNIARRHIGQIPDPFLMDNLENPHLISAFDANKMLSSFDRVIMQEGYTLDYVYATDFGRGEPLLYARAEDDPPIISAEEYCTRFTFDLKTRLCLSEATPENTKPYLPYLTFTNDPVGYFQMAMFVMIAGRFYLTPISDLHQRMYFTTLDNYYKCIDRMGMRITDAEYEKLNAIGPTVTVKINGDHGKLKIMTYKPTQGFSFLHVHLKWSNEFVKVEDEIIVSCRGEVLI